MTVRRLALSPFCFLAPQGERGCFVILGSESSTYRHISPTAASIALFAVKPRTYAAFRRAGFCDADLEQALTAGMLLDVASPEYRNGKMWESSNWSRAAFLFISQMNLSYTESAEPDDDIVSIVETRDETIKGYLKREAYPPRREFGGLGVIKLPEVSDHDDVALLDALFARQSCRQFAKDPVSCEAFAATLYHGTRNVRIAEASQRTDDPFFLLNSFYSWLEVHVVVQGVTSLPRCAARYDPLKHCLHIHSDRISDTDVAALVQGQRWMGGGGFCVFAVVQWPRYMWLYRHSRAYINLLIQIGEFGQEIIQEAAVHGLHGWMTPAVRESLAAQALGLPGDSDAMYFLKCGLPRR